MTLPFSLLNGALEASAICTGSVLGARIVAVATGSVLEFATIMCRGHQHVPLEEYRRNLEALIEAIQAYGARSILLLTPPPVDDAARIKHNKQVPPSLVSGCHVQPDFAAMLSFCAHICVQQTGIVQCLLLKLLP